MSQKNLSEEKSRFSDFVGIRRGEDGDSFFLTITQDHLNSCGMAHGGAVFTLADRAFSHALKKSGKTAVALEMKINYLNPVKEGDVLSARSRAVKEGRSTTVSLVKVKRGKEDIAIMLATAFHPDPALTFPSGGSE